MVLTDSDEQTEKDLGGECDLERVSTGNIERIGLGTRVQVRRATRLTVAHSKKWDNDAATPWILFAHLGFRREQEAVMTTSSPAGRKRRRRTRTATAGVVRG